MSISPQAEVVTVEAAAPPGDAPRPHSRGFKPAPRSPLFNQAIRDVLDGRGSVIRALGIIAGVPEEEIKRRAFPDPQTDPETAGNEDGPAPGSYARRKIGRNVDYQSKAFNASLLAVVEGRGSAIRALCAVTGLSEDSVKSRVMRARWDDPEPAPLELDESDRRYLAHYYRDSNDPAVRHFIGTIHAPLRRRPDWRSSSDRAAP